MALSTADALMKTLTTGQLFSSHPLPESDPFTPLLARYLPMQSRPQRKMQAGRRWHALANRMGEDILGRRGKGSNTHEDVQAVLLQWTIRLQCLRRIHYLNMLASEANAIFNCLPPFYTIPQQLAALHEAPYFQPYIPFELVLLQAVLPAYLRGDRHIVLQHLQEISYGCKLEYQRTQDAVWLTRLDTTAMAVVNILYTIGELQQAVCLLQTLVEHRQDVQYSADLCMLALDIGNLATAETMIGKLKAMDAPADIRNSLNIAKLLCEGQWALAEEEARAWASSSGSSVTARVSLAACCLYTEKVQEGIEILESLARTEPDQFYNSETNISNLIGLQELQAGDQVANKLDLLKECSRYASEALSLDCLRL